jgi:hypothetical protein
LLLDTFISGLGFGNPTLGDRSVRLQMDMLEQRLPLALDAERIFVVSGGACESYVTAPNI